MKIERVNYLGHSAVFLESNAEVIAIDPWLQGNPSCPIKQPERLDLIVLTHGHSDHAGDAVRLAKKFNATIVAIFELANLMAKEGAPNVIGMNKGGSVAWQGYTVTLTHALHSSSYNGHYAGDACGVVIRDESRSFYHAGDTAVFSDMKLIGELYSPDVAFLPIGDLFTMGPKEAAKAAELIQPKLIIPIHYGTFPPLTGTAKELSALASVPVKELTIGESYKVEDLL